MARGWGCPQEAQPHSAETQLSWVASSLAVILAVD